MAKIPTLAGSIVASTGGIFVGSKIAFSGTSGEADVIGLQSHEHNLPETLRQQLERDNYFLNLPQAWDMGEKITNVSEIGGDNLKFSGYKCFENFFPGAEKVNEHNTTNEQERINSSDAKVTKPESKKPVVGCSTMQLSYLPGKSKDGDKGIVKGMLFKSEIVAKNEHEGFALWTVWDARDGAGKYSKDWTQSLNYRFVYLSKGDNNKWEVKGGYEWEDAVKTLTNISAYIKVPNENTWLNTNRLEGNEQDVWKYKEFSGIWKETKEGGGKGIFNDMEVRMADSNKCEVMCLDFLTFSGRGDWDIGIRDAKHHYSSEKKKWFSFKDNTQEKSKVPNLIDESYKWIRSKVGEWEDLNRFCSGYSSFEADYDDEGKFKEDLINFCYSKSKTSDKG